MARQSKGPTRDDLTSHMRRAHTRATLRKGEQERDEPDNAMVLRLAAESCRDPRTVRAVLEGRGTRMSTSAVQAAAKRLGVKLPEKAR
jgi:hypothetical protein